MWWFICWFNITHIILTEFLIDRENLFVHLPSLKCVLENIIKKKKRKHNKVNKIIIDKINFKNHTYGSSLSVQQMSLK